MTDIQLDVESIWWRNVQLGEFYNIERHHKIDGGGGSLYIEIPSSMVSATLKFLGSTETSPENIEPIIINARVVGDPNIIGEIEFQSKTGGRMRIARQNRNQPNSIRHPAWTKERGFPYAPDTIKSKEEAAEYFPKGGLRIYIIKTTEGSYYAGFTKGELALEDIQENAMKELYSSSKVGGVIYE